jgi:hypothetical protein
MDMATTKPAKTTKATPIKKASPKLAMVFKALSDAATTQTTLDAQVKQVKTVLAAAGVGSDVGAIAFAGRSSTGGLVQVNISTGGFSSQWPEWAFSVAEGALHFNKKVWVIYNNQPFGSNLIQVLCLSQPV